MIQVIKSTQKYYKSTINSPYFYKYNCIKKSLLALQMVDLLFYNTYETEFSILQLALSLQCFVYGIWSQEKRKINKINVSNFTDPNNTLNSNLKLVKVIKDWIFKHMNTLFHCQIIWFPLFQIKMSLWFLIHNKLELNFLWRSQEALKTCSKQLDPITTRKIVHAIDDRSQFKHADMYCFEVKK